MYLNNTFLYTCITQYTKGKSHGSYLLSIQFNSTVFASIYASINIINPFVKKH